MAQDKKFSQLDPVDNISNNAIIPVIENIDTVPKASRWTVLGMIEKIFKGSNHGNVTGSVIFDRKYGSTHFATLVSDIDIVLVNGEYDGATMNLVFTQDSVGSRKITSWSGNFKLAGGVLNLAINAGSIDTIELIWSSDLSLWIEKARSTGAISSPPTQPSVNFVWGSPIATSAPTFSSAPNSNRSVPAVVSEVVGSNAKPTNIWWKNLLDSTNSSIQRLDPKPYIMQFYITGMGLCYPGTPSSNATSVVEGYIKNLTVECAETISQQGKVQSYDDLTMTYRWSIDSTHKMVAPIVRGTVLFTMEYTALTPKFWSEHAILTINGSSVSVGTNSTGTKFKITMNNGQTWIIYSQSSITLTVGTGLNNMVASSVYTGWIQTAIMMTAPDEAILDAHKGNYPTGLVQPIEHTISGTQDTQIWQFSKVGSGNWLFHTTRMHMAKAVSPTLTTMKIKRLWSDDACVVFSVANGLTFRMTLYDIAETYPSFDSGKVAGILSAWNTDKNYNPGVGFDPYFGGKALASLADLAFLSAHPQINDPTARTSIISRLRASVTPWLDETNSDKFRYDVTWGGIVSQNGLTDQYADFGNGVYNDHIFHYGYHIYAAAALAKYDPSFLSQYKDKVNHLVRDIINPSIDDVYFAKLRQYDPYHMFCWADGMTNFNDIHNTESSSEMIFGLYATALWGQIIGNNNIKEHARILMTSVIEATNLYWHHKTADTEFASVFEDNRVTGIAWETKHDYATWFGGNGEYIFGIQMIPYSPITYAYLPSDWVTEAWPVINTRVFNKTSIASGGSDVSNMIATRGTGYVGANGGYTIGAETFQVANNVTTSGGTGSGLILNININQTQGGKIWQLYVVNPGTGYTQGDIITLNTSGGLSGGSGFTMQVITKPVDAWAGLLRGSQAVTDKEGAWTAMNALTGFDDGTTKTNMLAWVASRGN